MIYLIIFLCYLVLCGVIALHELMDPHAYPSKTPWLHVCATPGLLFFVAVITAIVWITGTLRGK